MISTLLLILGFLLACTGEPPECDRDNPCDFGESCIEGTCVAGSCSTSAQCPMEYHCEGRDCLRGCETDYDCYPGFTCDVEGECVEEACEETSVDCGFREFCNSASGECYDAGGDYCRPCAEAELDCDEGNLCYGGYCLVDCSGGKECPSGFECYGFQDGAGSIVYYGCFTYCWLYDDYEPGSFSVQPTGPVELPGECLTGLPGDQAEAQ